MEELKIEDVNKLRNRINMLNIVDKIEMSLNDNDENRIDFIQNGFYICENELTIKEAHTFLSGVYFVVTHPKSL